MPQDVLEVMHYIMNDPSHILIKKDELTLKNINHFYIAVEHEEWKLDTLYVLCEL